MKISILGAGNVGGTLGCARARKGHDVFFGVPNPRDTKTQELLKTTSSKGRAGTVVQAAAAGEVIEPATPWASHPKRNPSRRRPRRQGGGGLHQPP